MYDMIVIGAGAAGMTAALYALRNGKKVLVLEGDCLGGQIATSPRLENYPSIKEISGEEFANNLFEQITDLGAEVEIERATRIEKRGEGNFFVHTEYGGYEGKSVVIAAGVKHKTLKTAQAREDLIGKGVYYCAVCDGAFYKGKEVAVIGDANTALQYALLLSGYCKKVYMYTLFDKFFGDAALVKALRAKDNIEVRPNTNVVGFLGEGELRAIEYTDKEGKLWRSGRCPTTRRLRTWRTSTRTATSWQTKRAKRARRACLWRAIAAQRRCGKSPPPLPTAPLRQQTPRCIWKV